MEEHFHIERAAAGLVAAWHSGLQPAGLRQAVRPPTLKAGYDVQDRLITLLDCPAVGWKIGLAGRNGYRGAGLEQPIFGRILAPRCSPSGGIVIVPRNVSVTVELEFALVIAGDVDPGAKATRDLIQSAHLGFEIVSSRLPDRKTIGIAATIADNAVSHAVVLGDAVPFDRFAEIAAQAAVQADGRPIAHGLTGDDLPDPLAVLGNLVAHLEERGQRLKRGDIVFTGTLTRPVDVRAPCELSSSGLSAEVTCRLEPGFD